MKLGETVRLVRGRTYKSSLLSDVEGPVLLGLGSIEKNGGFKTGTRARYPGESDESILLHPGDLYVSLKDLTQSCDLLGAVSRVPNSVAEGRLTQDTVKLTFADDGDEAIKLYVYWSLRTPQYRRYCKAHGTGTTNMSLSRKDFLNWSIPERTYARDVLISLLEMLEKKADVITKLNGYLAEQCEAIASHEKGYAVELASLCDLVKDKADYSEVNFDTYVSTESLLPGKKGRQAPSSLPQTGKVTAYKAGDILVSNIRPYFKKIWYADKEGTCSGDVLVFRAKQPEQSGYLYSCMRSDAFFNHVMKGARGTKMPRGDKKQMLTYKVAGNPGEATIDFIESALNQASFASKESHRLAALRDVLLPKLMSGEIDVSKIDLTQLNSHLA